MQIHIYSSAILVQYSYGLSVYMAQMDCDIITLHAVLLINGDPRSKI